MYLKVLMTSHHKWAVKLGLQGVLPRSSTKNNSNIQQGCKTSKWADVQYQVRISTEEYSL